MTSTSLPDVLLWDVDGTLAETERDGHRLAFNRAFVEHGLDWHWDESHYGTLLRVAGGAERLMADMARRADAPEAPGERLALARSLLAGKARAYAALVAAGAVDLRPGVRELMDECSAAGVSLAIVSTTPRADVDALLSRHLGERWVHRFDAIITREDVSTAKPDPEAYLRALEALGVSPLRALAIEDSPAGLAAANAADVPAIVVRSHYFATDPLDGARAIGPGLHTRRGWRPAAEDGGDGRVTLADLAAWAEAGDYVTA